MHVKGGFLAALAVICAVGFAPAASADRYGSIVHCESHDYRDNYCPTNTRGGVVLLRQLSSAPCRQGESWGYDRRGIWVTQGCDGQFQVSAGSSYGNEGYGARAYGNPAPAYGARPDYPGGSSDATVYCESRDYRYAHCSARVRSGVDLVRQRSTSPCRYNRTWGYDHNGIWVDQGCAAEFSVR